MAEISQDVVKAIVELLGTVIKFIISPILLFGIYILQEKFKRSLGKSDGVTESPPAAQPAKQPADAPAAEARAAPAASAITADARQVVITSHLGLFYIWPIWAVGLFFGVLGFFDNSRVAIVPGGTRIEAEHQRYFLVLPPSTDATQSMVDGIRRSKAGQEAFETRGIDTGHPYGALFMYITLLVVLFLVIPLRGLWSIIALVMVINISILLALMDQWDTVLQSLPMVGPQISPQTYLFFSIPLAFLWWIAMAPPEKWGLAKAYFALTPSEFVISTRPDGGVVRVPVEDVEVVYQQSSLFLDWVLGFGSGDFLLRVKSRADQAPIELAFPHVLFVKKRMEEMKRLNPAVVIHEDSGGMVTPRK